MIVKLLLLLIITQKTSRCSLVIDTYRTGLHVSDYCPTMKYCREGSHVMCTSYDPENVFGPGCHNTVKVNLTADLANQLLDVTNTIRSKIANGNEVGKNDEKLPRGYGIFRLKWDSELATFAQVLANTCVLRHDMCRATKRFPNPSQLLGLVRFTFPDWQKMGKNQQKTPTRVTDATLVHAITSSLKSWYAQKSSVTEDMVKVYPDWSAPHLKNMGKVYLEMVHGPATHMGCGISANSEYVFYEKKQPRTFNSILVVCNFSAEARKGTNSYETESPIPGHGFSPKCGCPPGSEEDADCLCNEVKTPPRSGQEPTCAVNEQSGNNCDPTLVLLPIFAMEDAPPDKLYQIAEDIKNPLKNFILQRIDNTSDTIERQGRFKYDRARSSAEMFDFEHAKEEEDVLRLRARNPSLVQSQAPSYENLHKEKQTAPVFRVGRDSKPPSPPPRKSPALQPVSPARPPSLPRPPPPPPPPPPSPLPPPPPPQPRIPPPPPPVIDEYTSPLKDHQKPRPALSKTWRNRPLPKLPPIHRPKTKKASIFTRVAQFQLPKRRSMPSPKIIKYDVAPRKDFSNLSKVVNDYLKSRPGYKIFNDNHEQNKPKEESKPSTEEKSQTEAVVTDTGLNSAEETVMNFNQYFTQKNNSYYNEKADDIKDDNDNKLLSLLDTLEQEVKHIALDGSEKELFDAKIRKIYGSIVGNTALLKFPKSIVLSTADIEAPEIDFGETKISDRLEPDIEKDNHVTVTEEPRQRSRYKFDQRMERGKNYNHKWKNKFIDSFDQKKKKNNMDVFRHGDRKPHSGGSYDHEYKKKIDHQYGDIDHKHMDDLDRKYNENINEKYSENHLDHEYKFSDNFHHQHNYDLVKKYDENEPTSRSKIKYSADRGVFREFEHNSLDTQEDITPGNNKYKGIKTNHGTPDVPLITKDRAKRKRTERKHRKRVQSLNAHNEHIDQLSLERRKYYQEKLDNIRKKLRNRKNRSNNDARNELSLRRMHIKNRESSRSRSKSPADNFYMPERARFLHGF